MNSNSDHNVTAGRCEFQNNLTILRQINFFSGLPLELQKVFAYLCTREHFKPGQHIFSQGDDDGCGYYILSGQAELLHSDHQTAHLIKTYEPGVFLGVLSLLGNMPRLFSLRARKDTTCLVITRNKFSKAVERFPEIMPKLNQAIVNRVASWDKQVIHARAGKWQQDAGAVGISVI